MGFYDFMTHFYARLREHVILALGNPTFSYFQYIAQLGKLTHPSTFSLDCTFKVNERPQKFTSMSA